jgi:integrase
MPAERRGSAVGIENGQRRQFRRRFETRKAAEAWLSETEHQIHADGIGITPEITLAAYAAIWHARMERIWAPSTTRLRLSTWRMHIAPQLGAKRVTAITRADCQAMVDRMVYAGLKPNTVIVCAQHVTAMLGAAVADEIVTHNRASGLHLPRAHRTEPVTWTADQARCFIAAKAGTQVGVVDHLMLATGMRVGEALALSWESVDLEQRRIRIIATLQVSIDNGVDIAQTTKTASSRRTVPITPDLARDLADHRARQAETLQERGQRNRRNLVFASPAGERVHPQRLRYEMDGAMLRLDLPRLTLHGFRHTAATLMLSAGVPAKVAQEMLGHATIALTMDTYSHVSLGMTRDASDTLGALLAGPESAENEGAGVTPVS